MPNDDASSPSTPSAESGCFPLLYMVDFAVIAFMVLGPSLAGYAGWGLLVYPLIGLILGGVLVSMSRRVNRAAEVASLRTLGLHALAWVAVMLIGFFMPDSDDVGTGSLYTRAFGGLHASEGDALNFTGTAAAVSVGALLLMDAVVSWSLTRDQRNAEPIRAIDDSPTGDDPPSGSDPRETDDPPVESDAADEAD